MAARWLRPARPPYTKACRELEHPHHITSTRAYHPPIHPRAPPQAPHRRLVSTPTRPVTTTLPSSTRPQSPFRPLVGRYLPIRRGLSFAAHKKNTRSIKTHTDTPPEGNTSSTKRHKIKTNIYARSTAWLAVEGRRDRTGPPPDWPATVSFRSV